MLNYQSVAVYTLYILYMYSVVAKGSLLSYMYVQCNSEGHSWSLLGGGFPYRAV